MKFYKRETKVLVCKTYFWQKKRFGTNKGQWVIFGKNCVPYNPAVLYWSKNGKILRKPVELLLLILQSVWN